MIFFILQDLYSAPSHSEDDEILKSTAFFPLVSYAGNLEESMQNIAFTFEEKQDDREIAQKFIPIQPMAINEKYM